MYTENMARKKQPDMTWPHSLWPTLAFMMPVEYFLAKSTATMGPVMMPKDITIMTAPKTLASAFRISDMAVPRASTV